MATESVSRQQAHATARDRYHEQQALAQDVCTVVKPEGLMLPAQQQVQLEPAEATLQALRELVVESRQLVEINYHDLVLAMTDCVAQLIATKDPRYALAIAGFALRIREEHLV